MMPLTPRFAAAHVSQLYAAGLKLYASTIELHDRSVATLERRAAMPSDDAERCRGDDCQIAPTMRVTSTAASLRPAAQICQTTFSGIPNTRFSALFAAGQSSTGAP